ncbi:MAG: ABC transporter ATP-binding protein [Saprospiraceae bacterium]|nr:ABC transporter ATP-binding protein [Saprospiraceae bacterium]
MFISGNNITFSYQSDKQVLNSIGFSLDKADTLAIVGPSGCGKSTLLRILSGLLSSSSGNHLTGDVVIDSLTSNEYRETGKLAFMFQDATLLPHLSVRQNIGLPLKIKGIDENGKVESLIKAVGLEDAADYLPKQLSGGMRTRVALARAFVTEPELLLLDEPFSALDIAWKSKLYIELEELRELYNTTVIMVTHDVQEAILLSDKIIVLNRFGQIQPPEHPVVSTMSHSERVNNISGFLQQEHYQKLFVSIQDIILKDGKRFNISKKEALHLIDNIIRIAGDERNEKSLSKNELDAIRDFSNDVEINAKLLTAFAKAETDYLKYQLIWDILEFDALPGSVHDEIFAYYFKNIETFSEYSRQWYALHDDERFFNILKGRIESNKGYNSKKKWIYLCDLYAVKKLPELSSFLEDVIEAKIEQLNYPFAKEVAKQVKAKIKE